MTKYVNNNGVSEMWLNIKNWVTSQLLGYSQTGHTHSASDITSGLSTVATSGSYADLSNKPTIPTVNNATLTIQKNGTTVKTFTANASSNVTANISVPTKTSELTNDSGFLTSHQDLSGYIPKSGGTIFTGTEYSRTVNNSSIGFNGGNGWSNGGNMSLFGKDNSTYSGCCLLHATNGTNETHFFIYPNGSATLGNKNLAMQEDTVPRSGGGVMTGYALGRTTNNTLFRIDGGTTWGNGASIGLYGKDISDYTGCVRLVAHNGTTARKMDLYPNGTWRWDGSACQITSDQRLKQQIDAIDDKLLDAWEDVDLVQFKYNDAVDQKKDKARLHTGYVVQQIDNACKSHGVDVSAYGLYCHEEYPQETEEVEVENEDGTTTKETKVIKEASEHYSLRYTEALIVECAYLRKCIKELRNEIEELKSSK